MPDTETADTALVQACTDQSEPLPGQSLEPEPPETVEIPRPFLTLEQAAGVLGKSLRALERSILGKWGNKLPEGWSARKMKTENGWQWRILPPPGFRLRQSQSPAGTLSNEASASEFTAPVEDKRREWLQTIERPTIIIDRSEEVEHLLRELLQSQKQLSEERRLRMEDMRLITQLQSSMRLLESKATETASLKDELACAQKELSMLRQNYQELASLPWWKRLFRRP